MFKLDLFDFEKDEIIRTVERNFCPTILYIEFEKIREKVEEEKITDQIAILDELRDAFLKFFPTLTAEEFYNNTVIGDVLYIYQQIIGKATTIKSFPTKNA